MLPQKTFLKQSFELFESDFDHNENLKISRLMEYMQNIATTHAQSLGFGWYDLDKRGLVWVVSKMKLQFCRPIRRGEKFVTICTWPQKADKFFSNRFFTILNENNEEVANVLSVWLIIDKQNRKIVPCGKVDLLNVPDYDETSNGVVNSFVRINKENLQFNYNFVARQSLLDVNGHVNNTHYVDFALDAVEGAPKQIEIVYHKEIKQNDTVDVYSARTENDAEVLGEVLGTTCFTVKFEY